MKEKKTKVINLFGGPGVGKSTTAAELFVNLKKKGYVVEMALEFAKEKVWEESFKTLDDQIYIFGKQFHRMWRLVGKVDYIIVDSPLPFSIIYNTHKDLTHFQGFVMEVFNRFDNMNYYVNRSVKYESEGRYQTAEEAKEVDKDILSMLNANGIEYKTVDVKDIQNIIMEDIENGR